MHGRHKGWSYLDTAPNSPNAAAIKPIRIPYFVSTQRLVRRAHPHIDGQQLVTARYLGAFVAVEHSGVLHDLSPAPAPAAAHARDQRGRVPTR